MTERWFITLAIGTFALAFWVVYLEHKNRTPESEAIRSAKVARVQASRLRVDERELCWTAGRCDCNELLPLISEEVTP